MRFGRAACLVGIVVAASLPACVFGNDSSDDEAAEPPEARCLDPRAPATAPRNGWLDDDAGPATGRPPDAVERRPSDGSRQLAQQLGTKLGPDFRLDTAYEWQLRDCAVYRSLHFKRGDRAAVHLTVLQLIKPGSLFNVPLRGHRSHRRGKDGSEVVSNNFDGTGERSTVVDVRADGLFVWLVAESPTAPSLAGWPTTTTGPERVGPPRPAPLSLPELRQLAGELSAWIAGR